MLTFREALGDSMTPSQTKLTLSKRKAWPNDSPENDRLVPTGEMPNDIRCQGDNKKDKKDNPVVTFEILSFARKA
ncbi:hypothetical protein V1477_011183 [Vespula maculifrons]|uniref:Uncharacterized protein n=4 Tax=Vespula TaxID=7451 RepID=A0A834KL31_VESGE|nr:hypothetical protein HZH66_003977 [Vespula vulgaris]KAF7409944.1 hypothetical protein HZH68_004325 [Vespula germanica]KAF7431925.1 hypothetical protein H0235_004849 [Vespula pensylvanica]